MGFHVLIWPEVVPLEYPSAKYVPHVTIKTAIAARTICPWYFIFTLLDCHADGCKCASYPQCPPTLVMAKRDTFVPFNKRRQPTSHWFTFLADYLVPWSPKNSVQRQEKRYMLPHNARAGTSTLSQRFCTKRGIWGSFIARVPVRLCHDWPRNSTHSLDTFW